MVETIGTQLRSARLARGLSLEDAAHVTKVRPARLGDLENDVYTNFPNIAYARGFLAIYGRFLGVDITPYLGAFEDTSTFGLDDYQYLRDEPVAEYRSPRREVRTGRRLLRPYHRRQNAAVQARRRRVPLVLGALALSFGLVAVSVWYLTLRFQQLGSLEQLTARQDARNRPPEIPAAAAPEVTLEGTPSPILSSLAIADLPGGTGGDPGWQTGAPALTLLAASSGPSPFASAPEAPREEASIPIIPPKEVVVRPLKRTYVKVVVNDPTARPAYEDWLGPNTRPLSFRGDRVFVHVLDKGSVEISKNGVIQPTAGTDIKIE